mgnify:CR=1 FL=1
MEGDASEGVGGDDLAAVAGARGGVGAGVDRLLDEPDRAVREGEVGAARVLALEGEVVDLVAVAVGGVDGGDVGRGADGAVGGVELAVLQVGLPVQRDDGAAVGAGCEIAISCDFRIAARSAFFSEPWIELGTAPALGGMAMWPLAFVILRDVRRYFQVT